MKIKQAKFFALVMFALSVILLSVLKETPAKGAAFIGETPEATFKAKCAACHTPTAGKFFDPSKSDEEHVQVIMKGKKGEKPPFMPGYEAKGMTEDEAKALTAHMKALKAAK